MQQDKIIITEEPNGITLSITYKGIETTEFIPIVTEAEMQKFEQELSLTYDIPIYHNSPERMANEVTLR